MWISGLILIGVVLAMALELPTLPLQTLCRYRRNPLRHHWMPQGKEAYAGIDWVTIFLFAGMLSVATAMEKTGAGKLIADTVVNMMGDNPNPYVLTAVLFLISNVLTQFMSNTASAKTPGTNRYFHRSVYRPRSETGSDGSWHCGFHGIRNTNGYSAKHSGPRTWRILLQRLCQSRRSDVPDLLDRVRHHYPDFLAIPLIRNDREGSAYLTRRKDPGLPGSGLHLFSSGFAAGIFDAVS